VKNVHLCYKIEIPVKNQKTRKGKSSNRRHGAWTSRKTKYPFCPQSMKTKKQQISSRKNPKRPDPMKTKNLESII